MKKPRIVIGGTQHTKATSFTSKHLQAYQDTKAYEEQGIIWVCPTRGTVPMCVVVSWMMLQWPMNQFHSQLIAMEGAEVGEAYNKLVALSMDKRTLRAAYGNAYGDIFADSPFILTVEEDNVLPPDAAVRLLATIFKCPDCGGAVSGEKWRCARGHRGYDAVSGLYFVKHDPPIPMAFGTPKKGKRTGLDFKPRSIKKAVEKGEVIEVNGIAMGCALWRKDLFRKVSQPWFETSATNTQDLYFCSKAKKETGARFGVHCGLRVGHYDAKTREQF